MAPKSNFWSKHEMDVLQRNYPKFGSNVAMWDESIRRDRVSIAQKANHMGIFFDHGAKSRICKSDVERLEYVSRQLCDKMGLSMRELVYEMAVIANRSVSK